MLCITDTPISAKSMKDWVPAEGELKHRVAIDKLVQLRLFTETVDRYASFSALPACLGFS